MRGNACAGRVTPLYCGQCLCICCTYIKCYMLLITRRHTLCHIIIWRWQYLLTQYIRNTNIPSLCLTNRSRTNVKVYLNTIAICCRTSAYPDRTLKYTMNISLVLSAWSYFWNRVTDWLNFKQLMRVSMGHTGFFFIPTHYAVINVCMNVTKKYSKGIHTQSVSFRFLEIAFSRTSASVSIFPRLCTAYDNDDTVVLFTRF